jgi:hypothetical protein
MSLALTCYIDLIQQVKKPEEQADSPDTSGNALDMMVCYPLFSTILRYCHASSYVPTF